MAARIIGIGQSFGGDDGVGICVLRHLREVGVPPDVELMDAVDPSALPECLVDADSVVLVDAVLASRDPGEVLRLSPEALEVEGVTPLSSHGMSVSQAIELARTLSPERVCRRITIVGVTIAPPEPYSDRLSPPVARAVGRAAAEALEITGA